MKNVQMLSIEIEKGTVFVEMSVIDEIREISSVKPLPSLKENIKGLTLINGEILPVFSYSDITHLPVRGVVVKNVKPVFFLVTNQIGRIESKELPASLEHDDDMFVYRFGDDRLINTEEIERYLS